MQAAIFPAQYPRTVPLSSSLDASHQQAASAKLGKDLFARQPRWITARPTRYTTAKILCDNSAIFCSLLPLSGTGISCDQLGTSLPAIDNKPRDLAGCKSW